MRCVRLGTTSPLRRITDAIDEKLSNLDKRSGLRKESNPNKKTGSKFGKRLAARKDPKPKLHRRSKHKRLKGVDMNDVVSAIKYIIEHHELDIDDVIKNFTGNKEILSEAAKKCMLTCLNEWKETDNGIIAENFNMVLSKNSWKIAPDGSVQLINGFKFNYDWLYNLANSIITEDKMSELEYQYIDKDSFADTLTNAAGLLRKMTDKEIKKYILNAAKQGEKIDINHLKEILEETGVNWKFIGAEVDEDRINLLVRVKYSVDGTQEGVVDKKLKIEVKPSADVTEASDKSKSDELDLAFTSENKVDLEEEPETKHEIEVESKPKTNQEQKREATVEETKE